MEYVLRNDYTKRNREEESYWEKRLRLLRNIDNAQKEIDGNIQHIAHLNAELDKITKTYLSMENSEEIIF